MKHLILSGILLSSPFIAVAGGAPWLPAPGSTNVQLSYVEQEADQLFFGDNKLDLPADRNQETYWLSANYGISDDLALDVLVGYSETDFAPEPEQDGRTDTTIGLTWRFNDEFFSDNDLPSAAVRFAAIIEGDYETDSISAIGDGASGAEIEFILGKGITEKLALSGGLAFQYRASDTPNDVILNLNAYYTFTQSLSGSLNYQYTDSQGDLDIGGAGFTPRRFDEVEEDFEIINLSLSYAISSKFNVSLGYGKVIEGRNAAVNDISSISFGTSF